MANIYSANNGEEKFVKIQSKLFTHFFNAGVSAVHRVDFTDSVEFNVIKANKLKGRSTQPRRAATESLFKCIRVSGASS